MAFVISTSGIILNNSTSSFTSSFINRSKTNNSKYKLGQSTSPKMIQSTTKPHTKTAANVVDTRVASRVEAHHWIVIKPQDMRMFERAAVAQADVTRQLEKRKGVGAYHRWVLRHVVSPPGKIDVSFPFGDGIYVVMEAFQPIQQSNLNTHPLTRRWLSAVERVGPMINTLAIQTRSYDNLFTCKVHDVIFNPNANTVVLNSLNVDVNRPDSMERVIDHLKNIAESSVRSGQCLEFCLLQAPGEKGFLKTIEVYKDVEAMKQFAHVWDTSLQQSLQKDVIQNPRSREIFKPVVFS